MDWKDRRRSSHVEDRRGQSRNVRSGGMGGGLGGGMLGVGGIGGVILFLLFTFLGGDGSILGPAEPQTAPQTPASGYTYETAEESELFDYVSVILADTEDVWKEIMQEYGHQYVEPDLVVYTEVVQSACGVASSQTGPFYCPGDQKLYIDLSFYDELRDKFQAPGDFAMAYVVAHEVGHHVQTLLGITDSFNKARGRASEKEANALSVRFELQADYLAGVWAGRVQGLGYLEEGDYEEAIRAAAAVGDDRIQKQAQGYVVPESFTHGTSKQRQYWFERGFTYKDLDHGDTFNWNGDM